MWIGCSRGREYTLGHSTFDLTLEEDKKAYWNYSFDEIGNEDVDSMINKIIAERVFSCDKVTLVTHSTGANSALVLA